MSDTSARLRQAASIYDASYPPELFEPDPRITTLSPNTVSAAAGATTVTVTGENFTATSVVEVNQIAQPTTFVSPTSLTISYDPTVAGTTLFTVRDGSGESNSVSFTVAALAADEDADTEESDTMSTIETEPVDPQPEPQSVPEPEPESVPEQPEPVPEPETAPEPE